MDEQQQAIDAWRVADMRLAKAETEMLGVPIPLPGPLVHEFIEARREYRETAYRCGQLNVFGDDPRLGFGQKY